MVKVAEFPDLKELKDFDFDFQPKIMFYKMPRFNRAAKEYSLNLLI